MPLFYCSVTDSRLVVEHICHSGLKGQEQFFALQKQVTRLSFDTQITKAAINISFQQGKGFSSLCLLSRLSYVYWLVKKGQDLSSLTIKGIRNDSTFLYLEEEITRIV